MPPPCPLSVAPIDFGHSDELIRRSYEDGNDYLEAIDRGRALVPLPMTMHGHFLPQPSG